MEELASERYLREILEQLRLQEDKYEHYLAKTIELYDQQRKEFRRGTWSLCIIGTTVVALGVFIGGGMLLAMR